MLYKGLIMQLTSFESLYISGTICVGENFGETTFYPTKSHFMHVNFNFPNLRFIIISIRSVRFKLG